MSDDGALSQVSMKKVTKEADRVAKRANIRDIRLFETSAELKDLSSVGELQWDLDVTPDVRYSDGDNYFVIIILYKVEIERAEDSGRPEEENKPPAVANISFRFGALYDLEPDSAGQKIRHEEIDAYARTTAIFTLHPYAREYIHDVTIRMGLPPLIMDVHPYLFSSRHTVLKDQQDSATK
jgi:hypothetical protein